MSDIVQYKGGYINEISKEDWSSIIDNFTMEVPSDDYKIEKINEYIRNMEDKQKTGMIMDAVEMSEQNYTNKDSMEAAITNDQMKKFEVLAKAYKEAHTQKVREFKKIGRNDPCPCGSGKKYKNCCLKTGKYENIIAKK